MGCCIAAAFVIALVLQVTRRLFGLPAIDDGGFAPPANRVAPQPESAQGSVAPRPAA